MWIADKLNLISGGPSMTIGVTILLVIVITLLAARALKFFLRRFFNTASDVLHVDPTQYLFFQNAMVALVYIGGISVIIYAIPSIRSLAITLFASAGIFAAVLGLASQQAFSNIIGGIFIVIFKPIRVNDIIQLGDKHYGQVEDINLRHTIIRTYENRRVVVPNSTVNSETIVNYSISDRRICLFLEMGISYDSDIDKALLIMKEEAMAHPLCMVQEQDEPDDEPELRAKVIGFGDSSVNLRVWVWADDQEDAFEMKVDLYRSVKLRFDKEGIEIPFPYRTLVFKDQELKNSLLEDRKK